MTFKDGFTGVSQTDNKTKIIYDLDKLYQTLITPGFEQVVNNFKLEDIKEGLRNIIASGESSFELKNEVPESIQGKLILLHNKNNNHFVHLYFGGHFAAEYRI